jgi:hypothetical protein
MYTSYFAKYKGKDGISIALSSPKWFSCPSYPDLFPYWEIINKYKSDSNENYYTDRYILNVLDKLDPEKVLYDLKGKVMLCWEKSGTFCHRRIVANWIQTNTGMYVPEI